MPEIYALEATVIPAFALTFVVVRSISPFFAQATDLQRVACARLVRQ
jgi:hypothetical protein